MSLVPCLCDMLLQRVIKYAPLIVLSTILPYTTVPILALQSVLELFNGTPITCQRDARMLRDFMNKALDEGRFLPMMESHTGASDPSCNISPYISSIVQQQNGNASEMRHGFSVIPDKDPVAMAMRAIGFKIYKKNAAVLRQSAFIEDETVFVGMLSSIKDCSYDLRKFFGGVYVLFIRYKPILLFPLY